MPKSSFFVYGAIGIEIMTIAGVPIVPASTAVKTRTVYTVTPDDSQDYARIVAASGICNDEPSWDDFVRSMTEYRQEQNAIYLQSLDG